MGVFEEVAEEGEEDDIRGVGDEVEEEIDVGGLYELVEKLLALLLVLHESGSTLKSVEKQAACACFSQISKGMLK